MYAYLVVLLVRLVRQVRNGVPRANLLYPGHLSGMVCLKRPVVDLAQSLATQSADGWPEDKVWD